MATSRSASRFPMTLRIGDSIDQLARPATPHGRNIELWQRAVVLPFSTDQFSNAADLERIGAACVLSPNDASITDLALAIDVGLASAPPAAGPAPAPDELLEAVFR
ncbi:MAG TPA: hypothetical protein VLA10_03940 [Ilumatobacter sp.]|nr:hypothetical protein [Ilumatobacter sp.]